MCGILSIINKANFCTGRDLAKATSIISHRGPDDEGILTWEPGSRPVIWTGGDTAVSTKQHWNYSPLPDGQSFKVGLGHRRLSILDLSPAGHQPMVHEETGIAITFNGEIYNFEDIKTELIAKGYKFQSTSDTEVLLLAWVAWGKECLNKLNGMFSFVILDPRGKGTLYAIRDRFGVKPLYYLQNDNYIVFASEIKQIRSLADYKLAINKQKVNSFLAQGIIDSDSETFDVNVIQVMGGEMAIVDLSGNTLKIERWYHLTPKPWKGTEEEAVQKFRELLVESVRLRLRADVPVGSCLSGGLDSSSIVCIASDILNDMGDHSGQMTVTGCFADKRFDEWDFASQVVDKSKVQSHRIFPNFSGLKAQLDTILWHQDDPFPSSSMYSQWSVFGGAAEVGLKVMIDGQGSDEQLSGYGGNDLSLYAGLMKRGAFGELLNEIRYYKKEKKKYPIGFIIGAFQVIMPESINKLIPSKYKIVNTRTPDWLKAPANELKHKYPKSLNESLHRQVLSSPLPSLLRYEDRNSMGWSIESRVPFLDYRFVEFTLGLPEKFVFKHGLRKAILRKAMKGLIPDNVLNRTDKMGFVTPEEVWLKEEGTEWFRAEILQTLDENPEYFNREKTIAMVEDMISGKARFTFTPWRIICFGRWMRMMSKNNYN